MKILLLTVICCFAGCSSFQSRWVLLPQRLRLVANMSVGALTTTFTPAPSCTTESYGWWYYESSNLANSPQVTATDADVEWYLSLGPSVWKDCLPSNYATGSAYFSPGICPDGYTAAGQTSLAVDNEVVTAATCCPQYVDLP